MGYRVEWILNAPDIGLVQALDLCRPTIEGAFLFQSIHGQEYHGPTYHEQLKALRTALASPSVPEQRILHGRITWEMVDALRRRTPNIFVQGEPHETFTQELVGDRDALTAVADLLESLLPPRTP